MLLEDGALHHTNIWIIHMHWQSKNTAVECVNNALFDQISLQQNQPEWTGIILHVQYFILYLFYFGRDFLEPSNCPPETLLLAAQQSEAGTRIFIQKAQTGFLQEWIMHSNLWVEFCKKLDPGSRLTHPESVNFTEPSHWVCAALQSDQDKVRNPAVNVTISIYKTLHAIAQHV